MTEQSCSLVLAWLKENHLLKTARALEQEYGKIPPTIGASLTQIIRHYRLLEEMLKNFTSAESDDEEIEEILQKKKKPSRSRKDSTSIRNRTVSESSVTNDLPVIIEEIPRRDPNVFVCPEMKERLEALSEELGHWVPSEAVINLDEPISYDQLNGATPEIVEVNTQDVSEVIPPVKQSSKTNIEEIKNSEKKKKKKKQESEVKTKNTEKNNTKEIETKVITEIIDKEVNSEIETPSKKKKKKKSKHSEEEDVNNNSVLEETVVEDVNGEHKKKKKKKRKTEEDIIEPKEDEETIIKKKKKSDKENIVKHEITTEDEVTKPKEKKKKKKKRASESV